MIWSKTVEDHFTKGLLLIVPNVKNDATAADMNAWQAGEPKSYKIRITNPNHPAMRLVIDPTYQSKKWFELDNREVHFKGDFRPRARYLYWHYCMNILRHSWGSPNPTTMLKPEMGKKFWGTRGKYVKKEFLEGIVEEMGHEYDDLLEGAAEGTEEIPREQRPLTFLVASSQLQLSQTPSEGEDDDDGDVVNDDDNYNHSESDVDAGAESNTSLRRYSV